MGCSEGVVSFTGQTLTVTSGGQVYEPGQLPSHQRVRTWRAPPPPAPVPRPAIVDACAALAGLGFGAVLAAVILGESRGSLAAPGGLLSAAGRLAGFAGTYLMLIMVVLIAGCRGWRARSARIGWSAGTGSSPPGRSASSRPTWS